MNEVERLWNLRDGVLAWLYELRVEQVTISEAEPTAFMAATSWSETVVTAAELNSAIDWLKDEGYVDGVSTMQGIVLRPCLSAYGERYAASGKSVRDLPGVVEVQSPYLHIEGSKDVAVAFGSYHVTQTVSVHQKLEQAQVLAEAIEQALPAVSDEKIRADAEKVAAEIRAESSSETPKPGRLKALAATAVTSIATAAGTDIGKAIAQAAIPLLS